MLHKLIRALNDIPKGPRRFERISGKSSGHGFRISANDGTWKTRAYGDGSEGALVQRIKAVYLPPVFGWIGAMLLKGPFIDTLPFMTGEHPRLEKFFSLILTIVVVTLLMGALKRLLNPRWAMYHAAEHKVAWLLGRNLEPHAENFRQAYMTLYHCGGSQIMCILVSATLFALSLLLCATGNWLAGIGLATGVVGTWCAKIYLARLDSRISGNRWVTCGFLALASLPTAGTGLLFEKIFLVREPEAGIEEEALDLLRRIHAER